MKKTINIPLAFALAIALFTTSNYSLKTDEHDPGVESLNVDVLAPSSDSPKKTMLREVAKSDDIGKTGNQMDPRMLVAAPVAPVAPRPPPVIPPTADCERIERFDLFNADMDTLNRTNLLNGTVLCREDFNLSIQAIVALKNCVTRVRFKLRGPDYDYSNTERVAPYFLFTNSKAEIAGRSLSPGNYTMTAYPNSANDKTKLLYFVVKRCRAPVAPSAQVAPATPAAPKVPSAPVVPVAPVAPKAPSTPVAPFSASPVTQAAPVAPIAPVTPKAPASPVAPVAPVALAAPVSPLPPVSPVSFKGTPFPPFFFPVSPVAPRAPVAPVAQLARMTLKQIKISPSSVNVTLRSATIDISLLVQDDFSGVQSVYASLMIPPYSDSTSSRLRASYNADAPVAGTPVPINMSMVVPRFTRSGRYVLRLEVSDGRSSTLYNWDGADKTNYVDVFNALEDVSPPKLLSLVALTPTTVNASSAVRSVKYELVVQDVPAGIKELFLSASHSDGSSSIVDQTYICYLKPPSCYPKTPIAGQPAKFNFSLEVKQSTKPGKYLLGLSLSDAAWNTEFFTSQKLAALNASSTFEVVNPEYDGQPPELKDLVLLSSSKVNVSLAPATIDLQLLVQDDISGFKYGTVQLYSPASSNIVSNATFTASKKVVGKATAYNVSLTIPKFVIPGTYALIINLFDFAEQNFGYVDLSRLSLPSKVEVSNTVVDSEPPVLVSFTTSSPLVVDVTSGPVTVEFQAAALDALSGVQSGYSYISCFDFDAVTQVKLDAPIAGKPVTFNFSFILEPSLLSGVCSLAFGFQDAAFQYIRLSSTGLISRGLITGRLTIVSSN
jgi:hypothetical protein